MLDAMKRCAQVFEILSVVYLSIGRCDQFVSTVNQGSAKQFRVPYVLGEPDLMKRPLFI